MSLLTRDRKAKTKAVVPHPDFQYRAAAQIVAQRRHLAGRPIDREAIVGAAAVFSKDSKPPEAVPPPSATRQWQTEAWGFVDLVGELSNAVRMYSNCIRRVQLIVGISGDDGSVSTTFDDEAPENDVVAAATPVLARLRNSYGSQSMLLKRMAEEMFVAGEGFLYENDDIDGNPGTYEFLSTDELRPISSATTLPTNQATNVKWMRYYGPGFNPRYLPNDAYVARMWRPHPRYSRHADSSVRALLEVLDEIVLLTREVRGETVSRLASAGILGIADEFSFPNDEDAQPGTENFDPFTREILTTITTAISDKNSAAGVAPMIIRGPAELIEKGFKYFSFARPDAAVAMGKRREALERFAQGIELPPEWIFGHMQTTFANAVQITDDAFRIYLQPGIEEICDNLTRAFLWPQLLMEGGYEPGGDLPPEIERQRVWYDASHLISKPDRSKDAQDAHSAFTISDKAYRHVKGFTEDDAPTGDEIAQRIRLAQEIQQRITIRGTDVNLPVVVDPALLVLENQPGNEDGKYPFPDGQDPYENATQAQLDEEAKRNAPPPPVVVAPGAPVPSNGAQPPTNEPPVVQAHGVGILAIRLHGAAEYAVDRSVDKVGAKLRSIAQRDPELAKRLGPIPNGHVFMTIGAKRSEQMLAGDPFTGEFAAFTTRVCAWAREHGCNKPGEVADKATRLVDSAARERLFDPDAQVDLAAMSLIAEEALEPEKESVP